MVEYKIRYRLDGDIYENVVLAASSGSAIKWVSLAFPGATDISVSGTVR